jgi:hypothetical protein
MTPSATLLYGFEVDNGWLPSRVRELTEEGMELRQALAAYLREQCADSHALDGHDDHVFELCQETELWVEEWGVERLFVTTRQLHWHQYDISYEPISMRMPTDADVTNLHAIGQTLDSPSGVALRWFLLADAH